MRLLRLLPEQAMNYWDSIKLCIREALPPIAQEDNQTYLRIQELILTGEMQVWAAVPDDTTAIMYAIMTTKVYEDVCSATRSLLIYSLTVLNQHPGSIWSEGYRAMCQFAAAQKCSKIVAYTYNPQVLKIIEELGGDTKCHFVTLDVISLPNVPQSQSQQLTLGV